jgi:hypothetical protein
MYVTLCINIFVFVTAAVFLENKSTILWINNMKAHKNNNKEFLKKKKKGTYKSTL